MLKIKLCVYKFVEFQKLIYIWYIFDFQLRVLVVNLIGFFWAIYLAQQRSKQSKTTGIKK